MTQKVVQMLPLNIDSIDKKVEEMTSFFNEAIEKYKEDKIVNLIIVVEEVPGKVDNMELCTISRSTGKHLQGLMDDVVLTLRRREWGEDGGEL